MITRRPPEGYSDAVTSKKVQDTLCRYVKKKWGVSGRLKGLVLLCGPPGTGKTHDAAGMMNTGRRFGEVDYWVMTHLLDTVDRDLIKDLGTAKEHVFLDDVGQRTTTGALDRVFEIVDLRVSYLLPTIVTMNQASADAMSDALRSRLRSGLVIDYTGLPDRRIPKVERLAQ